MESLKLEVVHYCQEREEGRCQQCVCVLEYPWRGLHWQIPTLSAAVIFYGTSAAWTVFDYGFSIKLTRPQGWPAKCDQAQTPWSLLKVPPTTPTVPFPAQTQAQRVVERHESRMQPLLPRGTPPQRPRCSLSESLHQTLLNWSILMVVFLVDRGETHI